MKIQFIVFVLSIVCADFTRAHITKEQFSITQQDRRELIRYYAWASYSIPKKKLDKNLEAKIRLNPKSLSFEEFLPILKISVEEGAFKMRQPQSSLDISKVRNMNDFFKAALISVDSYKRPGTKEVYSWDPVNASTPSVTNLSQLNKKFEEFMRFNILTALDKL